MTLGDCCIGSGWAPSLPGAVSMRGQTLVIFVCSPGTAWACSRALRVGLGLGREMRWPACRTRGATCVAPGKMEKRLTRLRRDPARAGVVNRKLAFTGTGPSLKIEGCRGEEDLPDQMG